MMDVRIIPILLDMGNVHTCICRLVDIGMTNIITADSLEDVRNKRAGWLTEDWVQRYKQIAESCTDTAICCILAT